MAQETVVKDPLTSEMVAGGKELVRTLDEKGYDVVGALWLYRGEDNQWSLVLALPDVDSEGPRRVYSKIQSLIASREDSNPLLALENIVLVGPGNPLIRLLKTTVKTGKELSGIRFTRNRINDTYIEDAYIYRVA